MITGDDDEPIEGYGEIPLKVGEHVIKKLLQETPDTSTFVIKDSGERRKFSTGAQRDRGTMKSRPDLVHPYFLWRLGWHLAKGAEKYTTWNWAKGMPVSEYMASAFRHLLAAMLGKEDEDHLAAVAFNIMGAIVCQAGARRGLYPKELNDIPPEELKGWDETI